MTLKQVANNTTSCDGDDDNDNDNDYINSNSTVDMINQFNESIPVPGTKLIKKATICKKTQKSSTNLKDLKESE